MGKRYHSFYSVWLQICDWLWKFGRKFENFSPKINWGHLINKYVDLDETITALIAIISTAFMSFQDL